MCFVLVDEKIKNNKNNNNIGCCSVILPFLTHNKLRCPIFYRSFFNRHRRGLMPN